MRRRTPIWRWGRACGRGSPASGRVGGRRRCSTATLQSSRPRRPSASASARCPARSRSRSPRSRPMRPPTAGWVGRCSRPTRASSRRSSRRARECHSRRPARGMPRSTEQALEALLAALEPQLPGADALRRRLHETPELAHEEHATSAALAAALPVGGEAVAGTGLLALVGGAGAPVGVRAELDGLPLREATGADFSATGETMHACGHDVHMAALVALVRAAATLGEELPAPLLAIFQPSEEAYPSGAEMIAEQALARRGPPSVAAAHVHPDVAWGSVAIDEGADSPSRDAIELEIPAAPTHHPCPHRARPPRPS